MGSERLYGQQRAAQHPICLDWPASNFFSGAILGNGGLGAVVVTRPDAVVIHFGHNDVWDIRLAEHSLETLGTFEDLFQRIRKIIDAGKSVADDPWFKSYCAMSAENYDGKPYPRPQPCGSLVLGFDRRQAELIGHRLDVSRGVCDVRFLVERRSCILRLFVEPIADRLWIRWLYDDERPAPAPLNRIRLLPDPDTPPEFPTAKSIERLPAGTLGFIQILPSQIPEKYDKTVGHPDDGAFRLTTRVNASLAVGDWPGWDGERHSTRALERIMNSSEPFIACVELKSGCAASIEEDQSSPPPPTERELLAAEEASHYAWSEFWSRSAVALDDPLLERTWYHNLYFLNCSVRPGVTCPGLFANFSYRKIGSSWHGDYHMNYNTQQPFWVCFSSNHVEKHEPYVDLVRSLLPVSQRWATEYYGLRGAFFPHSAYPVPMNVPPYRVPTWGWEVCETPWTVQSLWWHYLYTRDEGFLRDSAFEPIRLAVLFLHDYMRRPAACPPGINDNRYHIYPTVPPELYGMAQAPRHHYDCLVDLTLARFTFNAFLKACEILDLESPHAELIAEVKEILCLFPEYPQAMWRGKPVLVSSPNEAPDIIYNTPNALATVFPGEEHGLHSGESDMQLLRNTHDAMRCEGGNDLVFTNLQSARLGLLDLEKFKRQIRYCLMPNGACTDMALQTQGRYDDVSDFDFMSQMGVWFENFALPAVINECLLQSYRGELRLFPNWPANQAAEFRTLRAVGAFLVSSRFDAGQVQWVEVESEAGLLRVVSPWKGQTRITHSGKARIIDCDMIEVSTEAGDTVRLEPV